MIDNPAETLALTLVGEASGEGWNGMQAVANVILNRVSFPGWWGDDVTTVCMAPGQFDCWQDGPDHDRMLATPAADPAYVHAKMLAGMALAGTLPDLTSGADSYYADYITAPAWVVGAKFTVQIGRQKFYVTKTAEPPRAIAAPETQKPLPSPPPAVFITQFTEIPGRPAAVPGASPIEVLAPIPIPVPSDSKT
jgi:N-acetylmuramoyl-L-alanine amidase